MTRGRKRPWKDGACTSECQTFHKGEDSGARDDLVNNNYETFLLPAS